MISDSFEIPMPFTNRFAIKVEKLRLTFKFEVDVRVAVPGAVECVAPVHASIFESWIFDSQREQKSIFLPLFALPSDASVFFDDLVFPIPGDLW